MMSRPYDFSDVLHFFLCLSSWCKNPSVVELQLVASLQKRNRINFDSTVDCELHYEVVLISLLKNTAFLLVHQLQNFINFLLKNRTKQNKFISSQSSVEESVFEESVIRGFRFHFLHLLQSSLCRSVFSLGFVLRNNPASKETFIISTARTQSQWHKVAAIYNRQRLIRGNHV